MADPITLYYRGLPLVLTPVTDDDINRTYGYSITCPNCGKEMFVNTGIGPKPDHHLARNPQFQVTILPPIRCPFKCGWAVKVIDGIAYTCGNRRAGDV